MGPEQAERLVARASVLSRPDRDLIEAVFRDGKRLSELGSVSECLTPGPVGRDERQARLRRLRRRVRRLVVRMHCPMFLFVAGRRERWPATKRRVAEARYLERLSIREAAARAEVTYHTARRYLDEIEGEFRASQWRHAPKAGARDVSVDGSGARERGGGR